jgi:hypothetical protein
VMVPLGHCCAHRSRTHQLDGGQAVHGGPSSAIFAGSGTGWPLSVPRVKREQAGLTLTQKMFQEGLGGGNVDHWGGKIYQVISAMVWSQRKVCCEIRGICQEKLEIQIALTLTGF